MSDQNKNSPAVDALLSYTQGDEDGVMVFASRQAIHEVISELATLRKAFDDPIAWITEDSLLWLPKEHQYGPTIAFPKKNGKYIVPLYRKPIDD